jgi:hypothetical protein
LADDIAYLNTFHVDGKEYLGQICTLDGGDSMYGPTGPFTIIRDSERLGYYGMLSPQSVSLKRVAFEKALIYCKDNNSVVNLTAELQSNFSILPRLHSYVNLNFKKGLITEEAYTNFMGFYYKELSLLKLKANCGDEG